MPNKIPSPHEDLTMKPVKYLIISLSLLTPLAASAEDAMLLTVKRMSLETATKIAQGAISACRKEGIQIGVTVVNRDGHPQVVMRDVLAPDLTLGISHKKAYTALSFSTNTSGLSRQAKSPLAYIDDLAVLDGGVIIQAGGQLVGAVGVSGAPSGKTDEKCAIAGVKSIQDDLDMAE